MGKNVRKIDFPAVGQVTANIGITECSENDSVETLFNRVVKLCIRPGLPEETGQIWFDSFSITAYINIFLRGSSCNGASEFPLSVGRELLYSYIYTRFFKEAG